MSGALVLVPQLKGECPAGRTQSCLRQPEKQHRDLRFPRVAFVSWYSNVLRETSPVPPKAYEETKELQVDRTIKELVERPDKKLLLFGKVPPVELHWLLRFSPWSSIGIKPGKCLLSTRK